jgi:hypothetical protein
MATYTLISSNVLSSSAASVTFSSIPADYTDLVLKISARSSVSSAQNTINMKFNNLSTSIYSVISLRGNGATVDSQIYGPNATELSWATSIPAATSTSNTFNNMEIYIPSYTASQNKPVSAFIAQENNQTTAYIQTDASLFRSTNAITQIDIDANSYNFVSGSSFYLYGISNA